MDGNGRWATARRKVRSYGHKRGVKAAQGVIRSALENKIPELTLFGFSSENRLRPKREVEFLMWLFSDSLKDLSSFVENKVRLKFVGDLDYFGERLLDGMRNAEKETKGGTALQLNIALNYGGRWDIVQAVEAAKSSPKSSMNKGLSSKQLEKEINKHLVVGDVDLLIRSGGETRISNFLLWQSSYAEVYFIDTLWPDFDDDSFKHALKWFAQRKRKFGKTAAQSRTKQSKKGARA